MAENFAYTSEIKAYALAAYPSVFADDVICKWLNEIEGRVQTEVQRKPPADCTKHTVAGMATSGSARETVLVPFPFDKLYGEYICFRAAEASGETEKSNNFINRFNDFWDEYSKWYTRNYNPSGSV